MIEHYGSLKKFFIYNTSKSKNKQDMAKALLVLNLKKRCFYFLKKANNKSKYLKKTSVGFVKTVSFLLYMLLVVFNIFIIQKVFKKIRFLCKNNKKKPRFFLKNGSLLQTKTTSFFYHATT